MPPGNVAQLGVYSGHQTAKRLFIPIAPRFNQLADIVRTRGGHSGADLTKKLLPKKNLEQRCPFRRRFPEYRQEEFQSMKGFTRFIAPSTAVLAGGLAVLMLSSGASRVSAQSDRSGTLHIVKDCSAYNRMAGGTCTIVKSNLAEIPPGSLVHYTQAFGILNPAWLDSNVVLDAGNGNKAVGRCTVDFSIATPGVCTFQDGTGRLAGFTARVAVSTSPTPPADFTWDGPYSFHQGSDQN
jgi:hypothetical protein